MAGPHTTRADAPRTATPKRTRTFFWPSGRKIFYNFFIFNNLRGEACGHDCGHDCGRGADLEEARGGGGRRQDSGGESLSSNVGTSLSALTFL